MPSSDGPAFRQRARAESFGSVAERYDRFRPAYPAALIDGLAALRPDAVLDVGCGTGKATRQLAERGLSVLGVEADAKMAAVARGHGLAVEVGAFEDWDDRDRRFDLITAAQSWHWVDPARAAPKAARLLTAGGTLALFWNFEELDDATRAVVNSVYARLAPEVAGTVQAGASRRDDRGYADDLAAGGAFAEITTRSYPWHEAYTLEHWVGLVGTHSDHLLLGPARLAELQAALRSALAAAGDGIRTTGGTYTIVARPA